MFTRRFLLLSAAAGAAFPAQARPRSYRLNAAASRVGFSFTLSGVAQRGEMPVTRADLQIDPTDLGGSLADVSVDPSRAKTGFFFATDALKSDSVLATARFPEIRFVSTEVALAPSGRLSDGAALLGELTVRGITRSVRFEADLFRPAGSAPDDLSRLSIRLQGALSRSAFGANGYGDLVADAVTLDIQAEIEAVS